MHIVIWKILHCALSSPSEGADIFVTGITLIIVLNTLQSIGSSPTLHLIISPVGGVFPQWLCIFCVWTRTWQRTVASPQDVTLCMLWIKKRQNDSAAIRLKHFPCWYFNCCSGQMRQPREAPPVCCLNFTTSTFHKPTLWDICRQPSEAVFPPCLCQQLFPWIYSSRSNRRWRGGSCNFSSIIKGFPTF